MRMKLRANLNKMIKFLKTVLLFPLLLLFYSCGGDEVESVPGNSTESSNVDSGAPKLEPVEEVVEEKPVEEVKAEKAVKAKKEDSAPEAKAEDPKIDDSKEEKKGE